MCMYLCVCVRVQCVCVCWPENNPTMSWIFLGIFIIARRRNFTPVRVGTDVLYTRRVRLARSSNTKRRMKNRYRRVRMYTHTGDERRKCPRWKIFLIYKFAYNFSFIKWVLYYVWHRQERENHLNRVSILSVCKIYLIYIFNSIFTQT